MDRHVDRFKLRAYPEKYSRSLKNLKECCQNLIIHKLGKLLIESNT